MTDNLALQSVVVVILVLVCLHLASKVFFNTADHIDQGSRDADERRRRKAGPREDDEDESREP